MEKQFIFDLLIIKYHFYFTHIVSIASSLQLQTFVGDHLGFVCCYCYGAEY